MRLFQVRMFRVIRSRGSGADLDISSDTFGNYSVTINSGGSGVANPYAVGETFTIDGTLVGGSSSTHDVT